MDIVEINKVLSNKTRVTILKWLKKPADNFPKHKDLGHFNDGVCAQYIQNKTKLSQSTVSHYLSLIEKAGLIKSTRHGKWTYYKRNEELINEYINLLKAEL
jgi:ArsR family transcriptional regulator